MCIQKKTFILPQYIFWLQYLERRQLIQFYYLVGGLIIIRPINIEEVKNSIIDVCGHISTTTFSVINQIHKTTIKKCPDMNYLQVLMLSDTSYKI